MRLPTWLACCTRASRLLLGRRSLNLWVLVSCIALLVLIYNSNSLKPKAPLVKRSGDHGVTVVYTASKDSDENNDDNDNNDKDHQSDDGSNKNTALNSRQNSNDRAAALLNYRQALDQMPIFHSDQVRTRAMPFQEEGRDYSDYEPPGGRSGDDSREEEPPSEHSAAFPPDILELIEDARTGSDDDDDDDPSPRDRVAPSRNRHMPRDTPTKPSYIADVSRGTLKPSYNASPSRNEAVRGGPAKPSYNGEGGIRGYPADPSLPKAATNDDDAEKRSNHDAAAHGPVKPLPHPGDLLGDGNAAGHVGPMESPIAAPYPLADVTNDKQKPPLTQGGELREIFSKSDFDADKRETEHEPSKRFNPSDPVAGGQQELAVDKQELGSVKKTSVLSKAAAHGLPSVEATKAPPLPLLPPPHKLSPHAARKAARARGIDARVAKLLPRDTQDLMPPAKLSFWDTLGDPNLSPPQEDPDERMPLSARRYPEKDGVGMWHGHDMGADQDVVRTDALDVEDDFDLFPAEHGSEEDASQTEELHDMVRPGNQDKQRQQRGNDDPLKPPRRDDDDDEEEEEEEEEGEDRGGPAKPPGASDETADLRPQPRPRVQDPDDVYTLQPAAAAKPRPQQQQPPAAAAEDLPPNNNPSNHVPPPPPPPPPNPHKDTSHYRLIELNKMQESLQGDDGGLLLPVEDPLAALEADIRKHSPFQAPRADRAAKSAPPVVGVAAISSVGRAKSQPVLAVASANAVVKSHNNKLEREERVRRQHEARLDIAAGFNLTTWKGVQKERRRLMRSKCDEHGGHHRGKHGEQHDTHSIADRRNNVLYCPVEKAATTFFRRFMYALSQTDPSGPASVVTSPFLVPIETALEHPHDTLKTLLRKGLDRFAQESTSFLVVRDPFSRLFSAYVDKLVVPNDVYWKWWGVAAISKYRPSPSQQARLCGHDVTFPEFVRLVVDSLHKSDPHLQPASSLCAPCDVKYSLIGHLETLRQDFDYLTALLKVTVANYSSDSLTEHVIADAIEDSTYSAFTFQKDLKPCVNKHEMGKRLWHKMQMRGIISDELIYPLLPEQAVKITAGEFVKLLRAARESSRGNPQRVSRQKSEALKAAYEKVPPDDLAKLVKIYSQDFELFGYSKYPDFMDIDV